MASRLVSCTLQKAMEAQVAFCKQAKRTLGVLHRKFGNRIGVAGKQGAKAPLLQLGYLNCYLGIGHTIVVSTMTRLKMVVVKVVKLGVGDVRCMRVIEIKLD